MGSGSCRATAVDVERHSGQVPDGNEEQDEADRAADERDPAEEKTSDKGDDGGAEVLAVWGSEETFHGFNCRSK